MTNKSKLSSDYIRGLVEGEGTFTFSTSPHKSDPKWKYKIPSFCIRMHDRDTFLLEEVRDFLKLKNKIYRYHYPGNDGSTKRGPQAILIVRDFYQIKRIIVPLFYKKLIGNKGRQFEEWISRIGSDPDVPSSFKLIYKMYISGFYDRNKFDFDK